MLTRLWLSRKQGKQQWRSSQQSKGTPERISPNTDTLMSSGKGNEWSFRGEMPTWSWKHSTQQRANKGPPQSVLSSDKAIMTFLQIAKDWCTNICAFPNFIVHSMNLPQRSRQTDISQTPFRLMGLKTYSLTSWARQRYCLLKRKGQRPNAQLIAYRLPGIWKWHASLWSMPYHREGSTNPFVTLVPKNYLASIIVIIAIVDTLMIMNERWQSKQKFAESREVTVQSSKCEKQSSICHIYRQLGKFKIAVPSQAILFACLIRR